MIVFCGYANTDVVARIPRLPGGGERVHADPIEYHHGGMGANASVAAARAGADARFAGAVGDTPRDRAFLDSLAEAGVDTSWCGTEDALPTCVILVTPDGERSVVSHDDALTPAHVARAAARLRDHGGGWLYVDGYRWPEAGPALFADGQAPDDGMRLLVDLDGCADRAAAEAALSHAQHVVVGRTLLEELFGPAVDPATLAARFDTTVLVTAGAAGWSLAAPDGHVDRGAAHPVSVVDTTGAGDCFVGVYLAALDRGTAPTSAAGTAAVAAALSCTVPGPRGAPTLSDLEVALRGASPDGGTLTKEDPP
ncbi:carbohydrate kinase family protein [Spiractinospora alimapuensis]|uniref:carbohydrate kinase family protein n=1 Tax=Spiractinospora alimapuensis TaxID=2820884 RepID=UPI001F1DBED4|nr:carbohydrate kinase family protein [Spiractinospora alimapuensis]QVQ51777.1 carbohydrate kinase family protein [Spiractinospora alimapuensis]